jgi:hypothetical protein
LDLGIIPTKRKSARTSCSADSLHAASTLASAGLDDWDTDEQLRNIERALRINKKRSRRAAASSTGEFNHVDSAHEEPAKWHRGKPHRSEDAKSKTQKSKSPTPRDSSLLSFFIWTAILLGSTALLGGGISLGCSILGNQTDCWNFGLPFIVGGQIVLLVGLVLQLDRIWRDNRTAAAKLDEVDEELYDLKTTAALLSTTHSPTSSAFYSHYAGGANAQLLLTDLKSQLDLLAIKIAQE